MIDGESLPADRNAGVSVAGAIGLTTLVTGGGYAITLLQQALYARSLGVNADTDSLAAVLAWAVGTTGFIGTTLSTIYLPIYVRARRQGPAVADTLQDGATRVAVGVGLLLMLATLLAAPMLAPMLLPGGPEEQQRSLVGLLRLAAPLEMTWVLIWITVATVNARERYVLAAASWALPPLPLIGVLLLSSPTIDRVVLAYIAGTVFQLAFLWKLERRSMPRFAQAVRKGAWGSLGSAVLPVGVTFALLSSIALVVRGLASFYGTGAVATADYASRLVLAGQQVLLSGVLAVTFTRWSQHADARKERRNAIDSVERTLLLVILAAVATAMVLPFVAVVLTQLVLSGGRFTGADAVVVGTFVAWMAPGVGGHMVLMVAARALLAERRFAPLITASAAAVFALIGIGLLAENVLGLNGVAAGYSAGYLVAAIITFGAVWTRPDRLRDRRNAVLPALPDEQPSSAVARATLEGA